MYLFHRLTHTRWLFPWLPQTQNRYDRPRPLELFLVHPVEVLGFDILGLALLCVHPASWLGILIYLVLYYLGLKVAH
jgi:hypothetical protein